MSAKNRAARAAHRVAGVTRRAYQFATVPQFRSRGSEVRAAADDLRLLFRPATGEWFIDHEGRWHQPASDDDLAVALTELAVEFIDEQQLATIPHAGEQAWVHHDPTTDTSHFDLHSSAGRSVARVQRGPADVPRAIIRWGEPVSDDQWVGLTASLWASGLRDLAVQTYLPPHDQLGDKTMNITVDDGGRRHTRTVVLTRGDPTMVPLFRGETPAWGLRIGLHCQYPEPVSDTRELGFQLVSIEQRR